jgi:SAM-dependent methyltransferase
MAKKGKYTEALDPDKPHLGGNFLELNPSTHSPSAWNYIIQKYNIKSVLDVGSGTGYAAKWFSEQGLKTTAIDGLEYNVANAVYPTLQVDLTENSHTEDVDLVNCVEVVEHIEEEYLDNLLTTLCCGKYLMMTHGLPGQPGHHHVNCQPKEYWIDHLKARGFEEITEDSATLKSLAKKAHHIKDSVMLFRRKI